MIYGTHNSATGCKLCWWQKPFSFIINPFAKCQSRNLYQQIADGVKVFNLKVSYINGDWKFTNGFAIYEDNVFDLLSFLKLCASVKEPIYIQLCLDKRRSKETKDNFIELVEYVKSEYCTSYFIMSFALIEETGEYIHKSNSSKISLKEYYWTEEWADRFASTTLDNFCLPKYHAKKCNEIYRQTCNSEYLMLDYYNL
jgi:hypothetical protein